MRVLVTGGTGYLGYAVVRALAEAGHRVTVLTRRPSGGVAVPAGVATATGELAGGAVGALVGAADAVCHLAALTQARQSAAEPARYHRVNLTATLHLLDALVAGDRVGAPPRLVFASTSAVYGTPTRQPITEDTPLAPLNPYGATKAAAEQAVSWYAATGRLGATTLRIFNAAGGVGDHADPDHTRIIPRAVAVATGSIPSLVVNGDGGAVRDFVHIADVAEAFVRALDHTRPGVAATYNVGATPASVTDVVAATERLTGQAVAVERRPANPHEAPALHADTTRLREGLGWRPTRSTLDRMIGDQWAAARHH